MPKGSSGSNEEKRGKPRSAAKMVGSAVLRRLLPDREAQCPAATSRKASEAILHRKRSFRGRLPGAAFFPGVGGRFPRSCGMSVRFGTLFFSWLPFFRHSGVSVRRFEAFSILFCRSFRPLPAFCRAAAFPGFGIFAVSGPFRRPGAGGAVLSFPADGRRSARACRGRRARGRRGGRG